MSHNLHKGAPSDTDLLMVLIDRVGSHDETALRQLYDLSAPRLLGLAMQVVRHRDWAEDALQESFLTIWRIAGEYRGTLSPPLAWMGLIVRSRSLDLLRKRTSDRAHLTQEFDEFVSGMFASNAANPMDVADASEQARALHRCLAQLEGRQREVVSLAYLRELSHHELAAQLALPLGTVKTWIRGAMDKLRTCMRQLA
ncbi:RNA polymerase sigma factor [Variovorax sp. GT1P44]|uniref:RNA polymerase sigma factor n=1 Tax=Variovorax sp. GT1P44 TaxID=3443742 RepID=UPI003F4749EA